MTTKKRFALGFLPLLIASIAVLGVVGCSDDDDDDDGITAPRTVVGVTLREFSLIPDRGSAPAGTITFHVSNAGNAIHEFLVIRTNLAPNALPTNADGSYQENGPGTTLVAEIEDIDPNTVADLELNLAAGNYVLICNMVVGANVHYQLGMRAAFTVN